MNNTIKKIVIISALMTTTFTMAATYNAYIPLEKDTIKFRGETTENEETLPEETNQEDKCPTTFSPITASSFNFTFNYNEDANMGQLNYTLKSGSGYDNESALSTKRFIKIVEITGLEGVSSHTAGMVAFDGKLNAYRILKGESIKLTVTPRSYDMSTVSQCASSNSVVILNLNFEQIRSLPTN